MLVKRTRAAVWTSFSVPGLLSVDDLKVNQGMVISLHINSPPPVDVTNFLPVPASFPPPRFTSVVVLTRDLA
jgi:hypothetical protein